MHLKMTYFNTKRFLKSTIQSLKSYFAGGYQRLPKTPPCNPFSCTTTTRGGAAARILHTLHLTHSYREHLENTTNNHHTTAAATMTADQTITHMKKLKEPNLIKIDNQETNEKMNYERDEEGNQSYSKCLVTRKLKELEMMDQNNMDLVLDIQEVLHYYSRLTCPVYREIIDKFFVEMYSGTFNITRVDNLESKKRLISINKR